MTPKILLVGKLRAGKENDFTTIVTFGRDVDSGEMFVLGCEVNAE